MNRLCFFKRVVFLLASLSIAGCGGGSSGTGIQGSSYQGVLTDSAGVPLSGVVLTVQETGETVTTNNEGVFSLPLDDSLPTNTIVVQGASSDFQIEIPTSPNPTVTGSAAPSGDQTAGGAPSTVVVSGQVTTD